MHVLFCILQIKCGVFQNLVEVYQRNVILQAVASNVGIQKNEKNMYVTAYSDVRY